jgi:hypothetical protein
MDFMDWWDWIVQKDTGLLAILVVVVGLLSTVLVMLKNRAEIKRIGVDSQKAKAELRKSRDDRQDMEHGKIAASATRILDNTSKLYNQLYLTYAPLADGPSKYKKAKLQSLLSAVREFRYLQIYRPEIEKGVNELCALAGHVGDAAIDRLRDCVRSFCDTVADNQRECFVRPLESVIANAKGNECTLDAATIGDLKSWINSLRELHNQLPPLVGTISGRLTRQEDGTKPP